jgi:hypothetical protein
MDRWKASWIVTGWTMLSMVNCSSQEVCKADFPCLPGGGGTPGGGSNAGRADARSIDAVPSNSVNGRVCIVTDFRMFSGCTPPTIATAVTALPSNATAMTAADGTFTVATADITTYFKVEGPELATTLTAFAGNALSTQKLAAISAARYLQFQQDNAFALPLDHGTVLVQVQRATTVTPGVLVTASPTPLTETRYAGNSAIVWNTRPGNDTIAALIGLPQGTVTVTAAAANAPVVTARMVPVQGGAITIMGVTITP